MPPFRYLLRTRYPECDAQGIVFNARYGDWTDLATTELLRALDPRTLQVGDHTVDYRLRAQSLEWAAAARFDDVVAITPVVEAVGRTSFTVTTTMARASDGAALVSVRTVYVLVDKQGLATPVPDVLRAQLLAGAPGRLTDHSGTGGGRVVRVVRAADRTTMPWKNGGGVTHELVREGEGAAGFGARLSIAEVAQDGPFSRFPGVDRVIVLLRGAGFHLRRADGLDVAVVRPADPFAFLGEDAWDCTLPEGPVVDFNVMTDRATCRATVAVRGPGRVEGRWVLPLADGAIGGVACAAWDLAELDGAVLVDVPCVVVEIAAR
ncbi:MAG: HutD family protein [Pseudomonadota bacterium]|nr:HutD family protein [Pseudomonadota bacterium]